MKKENYHLKMENIIRQIGNKRPKLLLHSCCGPCSSAVIERLAPHFHLTVFYYNPNIDTKKEYEYRAKEQQTLVKKLGLSHDIDVKIAIYDSKEYYEFVKGFEKEPEGGKRCTRCFRLRLEKTAQVAKEEEYDYFTTTLSISPHKDSQRLNRLGHRIGEKYGIDYLYSDFKKKNGYSRSVELSKAFDMYRQDYCGCVFSKREMEERRSI
ncbi:MAG: epoxyqueuosine reductase QueH [Tissierellia bacterium]|nr:epoxyqueuosine reductase QueH [Tissierellia bacterium]